MNIKYGDWTPSGKVICINCESEALEPLEEGNRVTVCDRCGKQIQLNDQVAGEHELALELRGLGVDASMWQLGGMCSAVGINRIGGQEEDYYLITYNMDGDGLYLLGYYANGDYIEDNSYSTEDKQEMIRYVLSMTNFKRITEGGGM